MSIPDFNNTQIAFASKSDKELKKASWLFYFMNLQWFVNLSSKLGLWAINNNIPFAKPMIKMTMFDQFCGGTSVQDCLPVVNQLARHNVKTILDYGAEAKETEAEFDEAMKELLNAINFSANQESIPVISMKITGLIKFDILEKIQANQALTEEEENAVSAFRDRLNRVGQKAENLSVGLFVDAEESWIQDVIDTYVDAMMQAHNRNKVIIFNTFQMYRHDRLAFLKDSYERAKHSGYLLGAKLVRGAYMEKERARAEALDYVSPIQEDKASTDRDFNLGLEFCIDHYKHISSYNATHNIESNKLQVSRMLERKIDKNHPHLNFCQLYGMSDQITFNLGASEFNTMKYVPYGRVEEVIPYLIRRAQENTSVSGEMGREYQLITQEYKRRKG